MKVLTVFGTRPRSHQNGASGSCAGKDPHFEAKVCVTAQHREMLDQVLKLFFYCAGLRPQYYAARSGPDGNHLSYPRGLKPVLESFKPDVVLVHGDTTTTMAASTALSTNESRWGTLRRTADRRSELAVAGRRNRTLTGHLAAIPLCPDRDLAAKSAARKYHR